MILQMCTLLSPVLHGWPPSGANFLLKWANSMTRAHATTQHNSAFSPQPSPETYRHYNPRSLQHIHLYARQRCSMRPVNNPTTPV